MREMIKMVVVLTVLSTLSGGLLAAIRDNTKEKIEIQQLQFVKGPAIKSIFKDAANDPITDRFKIKDGETERTVFVGVLDGKPKAIALESFGKGYGGDVGLMVGIDLENDTIVGAGVTTHSETPGMGARAKEEPSFSEQFKGASIVEPIKITKDGGQINALSGATITSRAVAFAASDIGEIYKRLKPQIEENAKSFGK
jgi:electron transport complex protein RnfG